MEGAARSVALQCPPGRFRNIVDRTREIGTGRPRFPLDMLPAFLCPEEVMAEPDDIIDRLLDRAGGLLDLFLDNRGISRGFGVLNPATLLKVTVFFAHALKIRRHRIKTWFSGRESGKIFPILAQEISYL